MTTTQPWETLFDKKFPRDHDCFVAGTKGIKSFITSTRLSAYKEGQRDALNKVLESLPEAENNASDEVEKIDERAWNAYRLAAREIIKKLIED